MFQTNQLNPAGKPEGEKKMNSQQTLDGVKCQNPGEIDEYECLS